MASLQGLKKTEKIMKEEEDKERARKIIDMKIDGLVERIKKCSTQECLTPIKSSLEQRITLLNIALKNLKLDEFRYPLIYELRQLQVLVSHVIPKRLEEVEHLEKLDLMKRFAKLKYGMKTKKSVRKPKKTTKSPKKTTKSPKKSPKKTKKSHKK